MGEHLILIIIRVCTTYTSDPLFSRLNIFPVQIQCVPEEKKRSCQRACVRAVIPLASFILVAYWPIDPSIRIYAMIWWYHMGVRWMGHPLLSLGNIAHFSRLGSSSAISHLNVVMRWCRKMSIMILARFIPRQVLPPAPNTRKLYGACCLSSPCSYAC